MNIPSQRGHRQEVQNESHVSELRLFVEDICCDLCQFRDDKSIEPVTIDREFHLGVPGNFADIRIAPSSGKPYFIEVKIGYPDNMLVRRLLCKYGHDTPQINESSRVVLVADVERSVNWKSTERAIRKGLHRKLKLEVWSLAELRRKIHQRIGFEVTEIDEQRLGDVRDRIEAALGNHAFGEDTADTSRNDTLRTELLWHLGATRLQRLRDKGRKTAREVLHPGIYRNVAVLIADLSSFSSFVRDTSDRLIMRYCLTSFYTKARYQIVNQGGMFYQFAGDAVLAFFGLPDEEPKSVERCLSVARSLLDIGDSVSYSWQRRIDRIQPVSGAHIGLTIGDVEILSLRPFSRTRIGAVSDCINMASRLLSAAGSGQVVVSNSFYLKLDESAKGPFSELAPLDAKNLGKVKAWKLDLSSRYARHAADGSSAEG